MSELVAASGTAMCSMGTAPAPIKVTSQTKVMAQGKPAATITDSQGGANIGPFGMCTSMANPAVASATAAALGTLTPQPCVPVPAGTWICSGKVRVAGKTVLTNEGSLKCAYAGDITIKDPGQRTVRV